MIPINYFAVIACAVVAMILGMLWYGPLFGKQWMSMMGMNMGGGDGKNGMAWRYIVAFIGALLMAFVLANFIALVNNSFGCSDCFNIVSQTLIVDMLATFTLWLGFIAPVTIGMVLWEGKPWKVWYIVAGYNLVLLALMGIILSLWV